MRSRFKAVTFDLDGTLFLKTGLTQVAHELGLGFEWDLIDKRFLEDHELTLKEALDAQFKLLAGIPLEEITDKLAKVPVIDGVKETLDAFKLDGLQVAVLTDNPDFVCGVDSLKGFDHYVSSVVSVKEGRVWMPVRILDEKISGLHELCRKLSIQARECIHVGDWINDIPVFQQVGFSVALNPKTREVQEAATRVLRSENLYDVYRLYESRVKYGS